MHKINLSNKDVKKIISLIKKENEKLQKDFKTSNLGFETFLEYESKINNNLKLINKIKTT